LGGEQVDSVVTFFTGAGFQLKNEEVSGEWAALMFVKGV